MGKQKGYGNTAKSDQISITIVKSLLQNVNVYCHLSENDKTPNYDGYIEILDNNTQVGKIEVQVKTLRKKYKNPSKNIEVGLLTYIKDSTQLPFVYIVVDQSQKKAYWKYIDRQLSIELIDTILASAKQIDSIAIRFDVELELSSNSPYGLWKDTVIKHKAIFQNYPQLLEKLVASTEENERLKRLQLTTEPESDAKYIYLNRFLERLNGLLRHEFGVLKHLFLPEFYKFGIAAFKFSEKAIEYSLFAIEWEENQKPIIYAPGLPESEKYNYPSLRGYFKDNPILESPEKHAFVLIKEYVDILLNRNLLWPHIECLEREYLFFLFKSDFKHLPNCGGDSMILTDFKNAIEHYLSLLPASERESKKEYSNSSRYLYRALDYIQNFRLKGETEIQNLTPTKWQIQLIAIHLTEKEKLPIDINKTIQVYWENLILAYESFIEQNFRLLKKELSFWKHFDTLVIIPTKLDQGDSRPKYLCQFTYVYLKNVEKTDENKIIVDDSVHDLHFDFRTKIITYKNASYKVVRTLKTGISHLSDELPLRKGLFIILKERLDSYFKDWFGKDVDFTNN